MRLKAFILQENRSKELTEREAGELLNKHCHESIRSYEKGNRIYRGVNVLRNDEYRFIDPKKFKRKSKNTTNHYTELMDHLPSWRQYPKRSQSIICSTSYEYARGFGTNLYAVFPYDGAKIGVCPSQDLWTSFRVIVNYSGYYDMDGFNKNLRIIMKDFLGIKKLPSDFNQMKKVFAEFDKMMKDDTVREQLFMEQSLFRDFYEGNMLEFLNIIMDPDNNGFYLAKSGDLLPPHREVWTDSKSILVAADVGSFVDQGLTVLYDIMGR
jgi:hypothetical protein